MIVYLDGAWLAASAGQLGIVAPDRDTLTDAQELLATMTSVGVAPIRAPEARALPAGTPASDELHARYWKAVSAVCAAADPGLSSV